MISFNEDGLLSQLGPLLAVVVPDTVRTDMHLIGELDVATAQILDTLIEQQIATGHLDVRLDVSGLSLCDVRGLRALLRARRRLVAAGGQLKLLHPAPLLVRVVGLCGWGAELGFEANGAAPAAGARQPGGLSQTDSSSGGIPVELEPDDLAGRIWPHAPPRRERLQQAQAPPAE